MTKRRANGEGSIWKTPTGYAISLSYRKPNGSRGRKSARAKSHTAAVARLAELRSQVGLLKAPDGVTIASLGERFIASLDVAPKTLRQRSDSAGHVKAVAGDRPVQSITSNDVMQILADLKELITSRNRPVGPRSRQVALTYLRGLFDYAVTQGIITSNPAHGIKRPECQSKEIFPFTAEECSSIISAASRYRLGCAVSVKLLTGLRSGELLGLQWRDIHFKTKRLQVNRQLAEGKARDLKRPKTKASLRTVPLSRPAVEILSRRRELAEGEGFASSGDFVFPGKTGTAIWRSSLMTGVWQPILKTLGLKNRGLHHCRHTFATLLLGQRVSPHIVAKLLGHSSVAITLMIYAHYLPGVDVEVVDELGSLMVGSATTAPSAAE